ncbi:stage III sporulation protein AF [Sporolactobacillus terrae]|uniref:Stage III sporulation protein AF n=1 Tax=Sporolactobacillus terrae TaxID=269673 RepID=A0A410D9C2_9BACL|nr:stage III sporulation protein AF [Sporolactobacillus terrae]QAA22732.1 stage III sporulation protein AF [Sporolactobacillus terrae]QAA25705.1 stage III sporulation protein AF [Sporolactobacillus terrae]UAK17518.1 stage III sporulation protein AF [Sporolactobacillus terrae]BBN99066.1 stage III sporulation protein AF [Sporolactobacillus terrae]
MGYLVHWISQIVLIVLFAVILELLMPSGVFQKYIKFVIGLVLIIALMDPVIRLFHVDPNSLLQGINTQKYNEPVKKETARQKSEIEKAQAAYIQEQVVVHMKNQVKEELNEQYGLQIAHLELSAAHEDGQDLSVRNVKVTVEKAEASHRRQESGIRSIQPVQSVSVDLDKQSTTEKSVHESNEMKDVRAFLAKRWELNERLISVNMEGGE